MRHFIIALCLFIALPACAQIPTYDEGREANQAEIPYRDSTMATPSCLTYVEWTGQNIDDIDLSVLGDRPHRIIRPDSMVTMDYIPDRLNINVDTNGTILTQECG